jgi:glycerol-1-phosphate dehydrogenase [NAD(P)+]
MTKTLFVTDKTIWQNCQKFFPENFLKEHAKNLFLEDPKPDEKNLRIIAKEVKNCDFILALGSGTINDLCKFTSAREKIPYAVFASAPSMNGYLSKNASITVDGHKKTLPATLPETVFYDLRILKSAPLRLIKAGIGDSLCFYSCWFDWYLSHKLLGTKFSTEPLELLRKKMKFFVKNFRKFSLRDEEFLQLLMNILLLSGEGMTMAQGSYPASQSEHLISHAIEMKYPEVAKNKLHGEMIAVTTLTSAKLQKDFLSHYCEERNEAAIKIEMDCHSSLRKARNEDLKNGFFSKKITKQCKIEYAAKTALKLKKVNWPKLKQELQKIHLDESLLKEIFKHFKIKTSARSLGLSNKQYQDCVANAKFIRNRFTCLDIAS